MKCQNDLDPFFRAVYNKTARECFVMFLAARMDKHSNCEYDHVKDAAELAYYVARIFADEYMARNFTL